MWALDTQYTHARAHKHVFGHGKFGKFAFESGLFKIRIENHIAMEEQRLKKTQYIICNLQVHYLPNLMNISYAHVWHKIQNNNDESQVTSPTKVNKAK